MHTEPVELTDRIGDISVRVGDLALQIALWIGQKLMIIKPRRRARIRIARPKAKENQGSLKVQVKTKLTQQAGIIGLKRVLVSRRFFEKTLFIQLFSIYLIIIYLQYFFVYIVFSENFFQ